MLPFAPGLPSGIWRPVESLATMSRSRLLLLLSGSPSRTVNSPHAIRRSQSHSVGLASISASRRYCTCGSGVPEL